MIKTGLGTERDGLLAKSVLIPSTGCGLLSREPEALCVAHPPSPHPKKKKKTEEVLHSKSPLGILVRIMELDHRSFFNLDYFKIALCLRVHTAGRLILV